MDWFVTALFPVEMGTGALPERDYLPGTPVSYTHKHIAIGDLSLAYSFARGGTR